MENLNAVNILTGVNNSGKTSVLELLEIFENPADFNNWLIGTRAGKRRIGSKLYDGIYNMFPLDDEKKSVTIKVRQFGASSIVW